MKRSSAILIVLIIAVPLVALAWAMLRIAENEKVVVQQRFRELLVDRLQDVNVNIGVYFQEIERQLSQATAIDDYDIGRLRTLNRSDVRLLQLFVLSPEGQLLYPDPTQASGPLSGTEREFLIEAAKMFTGQDLKEAVLRSEQDFADGSGNWLRNSGRSSGVEKLPAGDASTAAGDASNEGLIDQRWVDEVQGRLANRESTDVVQQQIVNRAYQVAPVRNMDQFRESSGWFVWYWDRGVNLIYWQRRPSGEIVGGALERARWMADLIGQLPDTLPDDSAENRSLGTRVRLVNEAGGTVYQWGNFEPAENAGPFCEVAVAAPLTSWRLQCFVSESYITAGTGQSIWLSLMAVLVAVAVTLAVCGVLFVREYSRDMREAAQQVSFVNQVSHELKTPLTNIRMYAELLERDLDGVDAADAEKPRQRLSVILSEGQRLSRLIGNVLTFARQQRRTLQVQARRESPGRMIHQIVDRFRPALQDLQIEVQLQLQDSDSFVFDPDFLEQILGNLISNVEKYAAAGGLLRIDSHIQGRQLIIDVRDAGPGIAVAKRDTVFEPFARLSNSVSYAAGTGIGLSIARELAQLHGGNLVLKDCDTGCWFQATICEYDQ